MDLPDVDYDDVDDLVYQLESDDLQIKRESLHQLRLIAKSCDKRFPVRNARRFLNSTRRRLNDREPSIVKETLALIHDIVPLLCDDVDMILTLVIPHVIRHISNQDIAVDILWTYARCSDDMLGVTDALTNIGMSHEDEGVREASVLAMKTVVSERKNYLKYTEIDYQELLQILVSLLEDDDAAVVVAAEETIGCFKGHCRDFDTFAKRLNKLDRLLLHDHYEFISRFIPTPRRESEDKEPLYEESYENINSNGFIEMAFGFVPQDIVNKLSKSANEHDGERIVACHELLEHIAAISSADAITTVEPFLADLIAFLGVLSNDRNFKVEVIAIESLQLLVDSMREKIVGNLRDLTPILIQKLGDPKIKVRICSRLVFRALMDLIPNETLLSHLQDALSHKNWHIREEGLKVLMLGLLKKPDDLVSSGQFLPPIATLISDTNEKVRYAAIEACAVFQFVMKGCLNIFHELGDCGAFDDVEASDQVRARLQSKELPIIAKDGSLQYTYVAPHELSQAHHLGSKPRSRDAYSIDLKYERLTGTGDIVSEDTVISPDRVFHRRDEEVRHVASEFQIEDDVPSDGIASKLTSLKQRRSRRGTRRSVSASASTVPGLDSLESVKMTRSARTSGGQRKNTETRDLSHLELSDTNNEPKNPDERPISPMRNSPCEFDEVEDSIPVESRPEERPIRPMRNSSYEIDEVVENSDIIPVESRPRRIISKATQKRLASKDQAKTNIHVAGSLRRSQISTTRSTKVSVVTESALDPTSPVGNTKGTPTYMGKSNIEPLKNPKASLGKLSKQLKSSDWEENFQGLDLLRCLAMHHAEVIKPKIHDIVKDVMSQINNLRSSVAKNAMLALQSMLESLQRSMDPVVEDFLPVLLKRSADTNAFISSVADSVIASSIENLSLTRIFSALAPFLSAKSSTIRVGAAKTVDGCIQKWGGRLAENKELNRVLKAVGDFLVDSSADVRDVAKRTTTYILEENIVDMVCLSRVMPSSAYRKVEHIAKTQGGSCGSVHIRKEEKIRRIKPPGKSQASKLNDTSLSRVEEKLASGNWRDRCEGIENVKKMLLTSDGVLAQMSNIFDLIGALLEDGNLKVNTLIVEALLDIIPYFGKRLEPVLPVLIPPLSTNLASSNRQITALANDAMDTLIDSVDGRMLCQPFADIARFGNSRIKPQMLSKLAKLVPAVYASRPSSITRHVVPLVFSLLDDRKNDIRQANIGLLRCLHVTMGGALIQHTHQLTDSKQGKILSILKGGKKDLMH